MQFDELQLVEPLLRTVRAEGYTQPSPIQEQAIPYILQGRDMLGCAQTGTGKTAAFALPILQRLMAQKVQGAPYLRVLVLSPTRELASQIGESFATYGKLTHLRQITIFGGVNARPQIDQLRRGADILVATPGRLLDLMSQGYIKLDRLEVLVLDEADRMLDMGFINDVRKIVAKLPTRRQTLLFSATMPEEIRDLADSLLTDPAHVAVTPVASTVETIDQSIYFVEKGDKAPLLKHLLRNPAIKRVLVFTRTKHGANKVVRLLEQAAISSAAIHGNKSQSAREAALTNFKAGRVRVLVATDIAARGLDVDLITHVINYDLPNEPESYVHRIGRTGRAGASGIAYSFCDVEERAYLVDIERLTRQHIPRATDYPYVSPLGMPPVTDMNRRGNGNNHQSNNNQNNNRNNANRNNNSRGSSNRNYNRNSTSQNSSQNTSNQNGQQNHYRSQARPGTQTVSVEQGAGQGQERGEGNRTRSGSNRRWRRR